MLPSLPTSYLAESLYGHWEIQNNSHCPCCGCSDSLSVSHELKPDFHPPFQLVDRLTQATSSICLLCGHLYRSDIYSREEIDTLFSLLVNKDDSTTGNYLDHNAQHSFSEKINSYNFREMELWRNRIEEFSISAPDKVFKDILFIRPASLSSLKALKARYPDSNIYWIDYSRFAIQQILSEPTLGYLEIRGSINSYLDINIGHLRFDLVIVNHCLQHSISLSDDLACLKNLAKKEGCFLFANEVNRKLHNPFHTNHFSEYTLTNYLRNNFTTTLSFPNNIPLDVFKQGLFAGGINKDILAYS